MQTNNFKHYLHLHFLVFTAGFTAILGELILISSTTSDFVIGLFPTVMNNESLISAFPFSINIKDNKTKKIPIKNVGLRRLRPGTLP